MDQIKPWRLKNPESGSGTEQSATEEKSCPGTTEPSKAAGTFQKTGEDKEGIEEFEFETAPWLHIFLVFTTEGVSSNRLRLPCN